MFQVYFFIANNIKKVVIFTRGVGITLSHLFLDSVIVWTDLWKLRSIYACHIFVKYICCLLIVILPTRTDGNSGIMNHVVQKMDVGCGQS
jgi:hypothetical protein